MCMSKIPECKNCGSNEWKYIEVIRGWNVSKVAFNLTNNTFDTYQSKVEDDFIEIDQSIFECADCGNQTDLDFEREYSDD